MPDHELPPFVLLSHRRIVPVYPLAVKVPGFKLEEHVEVLPLAEMDPP
jgi:hypothetical protein